MSKIISKGPAPKLRFAKRDGGVFPDWEYVPLHLVAKRVIKKNKENIVSRVLTNSASDGVVEQRDYFNKDIAVKGNLDGYYIVEYGDYVYNPRISSLAPVGPISKNHVGLGVMSPLYTVFRFNNSNNDFYEQFFKFSSWHEYLKRIANMGARYDRINITNSEFMEMPVPKPDYLEQEKIADCLSSIDNLITKNTTKLELLKLHKKGLMQKLFPEEGKSKPDLRLGGFYGAWKKRKFSKLFEIGSGKDHKNLADGDIPVYGSGGYMRSVNDYLYEGKSACIGRKGTINKPMLLAGKFWTVDTLFYTHSFKNCIPEFIYLLFQNIDWLKLNEAGGVPSLSKVIINNIEVFIPEEDEQQRIVDCVSSLDELIKIESDKIEALKEYKKGLMQKLFPEIKEFIA